MKREQTIKKRRGGGEAICCLNPYMEKLSMNSFLVIFTIHVGLVRTYICLSERGEGNRKFELASKR